MKKCQHDWQEIERFYAPPAAKDFELKGMEVTKPIERFVFGLTTILYQCSKCHVVNIKEILGKSMKTESGDAKTESPS